MRQRIVAALLGCAWVPFSSAADCLQPPPEIVLWLTLDGHTNDEISGCRMAESGPERFVVAQVSSGLDLGRSFVTIPNSPALNPPAGITVGAWWKAVDFTGDGNNPIVDKGYIVHDEPYYEYHLGVCGAGYCGLREFLWNVTTNVSKYTVRSGDIWRAGLWYLVVGTYDGVNVSLYVNGSLVNSVPASGSLVDYGKDVFVAGFGNLPHVPPHLLPGILDEVFIANRAFSAGEIGSIFAVGSAGICKCGTFDLDGDGFATLPGLYCRGGASVDCDDTDGCTFPGASNWCSAKDNDCDGTIAYSTTAPPAALRFDRWDRDGTTYRWETCGPATFDVQSGDVATLIAGMGDYAAATNSCEGSNLSAPWIESPSVPSIGDARFYVVRAIGACGSGTFDDMAPMAFPRDSGIAASASACP